MMINAESLPPHIVHVDLDAFFASVEQLHDPCLVGRAVLVGGSGPRGVVATASYEARRFGVRSAMPMRRARQLCPHAVVVAPRMEVYGSLSRRVMAILAGSGAALEQASVDEAYLDMASVMGDGPTGAAPLAAALRRQVHTETGLVVSVGVGTSKLVAKLASAAAKPDGMVIVLGSNTVEFLHALPVTSIPGVGPATFAKLGRYGVVTIGDLAAIPEATLMSALGRAAGHNLAELAWGRDNRMVSAAAAPPKSISQEETYDTDLVAPHEITSELRALSVRVAGRLFGAGVAAGSITLRVRRADFSTITRTRTLLDPSDDFTVITAVATELFAALPAQGPIRLLGVIAASLTSEVQETLFPAMAPLAGAGPGALDTGGLVPGEQVDHPVFGPGTVERVGPEVVVVRFADRRARPIDVAYTALTRHHD